MSTDDAPQSSLPDLRFVPVESLVLHERHDPGRSAPLVRGFREPGVLRNPTVPATLPPDDPRFVVLDGANRATAAGQARLPHIVAQVVSYEDPGARRPAGITRHRIPGRALRVNVPLERLADREQTLAEKNRWLEGWLREKAERRQVRVCRESAVLFDE